MYLMKFLVWFLVFSHIKHFGLATESIDKKVSISATDYVTKYKKPPEQDTVSSTTLVFETQKQVCTGKVSEAYDSIPVQS